MIPLPKLLDVNMQESRRILPIDASVKENMIPLSYATIQLAENEEIPARSYVEMFTPNGSAGIFRTKTRPNAYGDSMAYLELEHAVTEIGDFLVREDIEEELPLSAAFARLFSHYRGDKWQLGTIPYTDLVVVDMAYEPIIQGMLLVLNQVPKYYLTFDFETTPWTLSVAERDTVVSAEGRLGRNVKSADVKPDDSNLCTRVYMKGLPLKPGQGADELGYIDADTTSLYGVVEQRLDGTDSLTEEQAVRKATAYLSSRKRPKLGISISGADFSSVTGETLDRVAIGKLYRLAVPKHHTTVEENITGIEWRSVYKNPKQVQIDLSEEEDPTVDFLRKQLSSSRGSRRANAKEIDYFYNELFSDDGIIHSIILQTSTIIRTEVGSVASGIYGSVIEQTATYIHTVVYDTASAISQSVIEQTAEYVRTEVESTASGVAWSVVEQTMTGIIQEVGRKNKVYVQLTDPNDGFNELQNGDIWIFSAKRTWNEMADLKWGDVERRKWRDYYGGLQYVWRDGGWVKVLDEAAIVESKTWVEQTNERYSILARQVDSLDEVYNSKLTVTAREIRGEVSTAKSQLYSVVFQTATNVFSGVYDKVNDNFSTIEQTSQQISIGVNSAKSSLYAAINVTSTQISLKVGKGEVISCINQTAESITINANRINLEGYATFESLDGNYLKTKLMDVSGLSVGTIYSTDYELNVGGRYASLGNALYGAYISLNSSTNVYTLHFIKPDGSAYSPPSGYSLNFSRATSLDGGWSSGKFTVTADPQGDECYTQLSNGSISRSGRSVTIPIKATVDGGATFYNTGHNATGTITAAKSEISCTRGTRRTSEPSADNTIAKITANGWYVITIEVLGCTKTYKLNIEI